jgi:putative acetyltransferase
MTDRVTIRTTTDGDAGPLRALYGAAFPAEELRPLVARLLAEEPEVLSLAATVGGDVVGHVLFTPCGVAGSDVRVALLGPLAVVPARQKQGIGRALVLDGFGRLGRTGTGQVLVLGDPAYYQRFGFRPERAIAPPYDLPPDWTDAWQSVRLDGERAAAAGRLQPPPAWQTPALWLP